MRHINVSIVTANLGRKPIGLGRIGGPHLGEQHPGLNGSRTCKGEITDADGISQTFFGINAVTKKLHVPLFFFKKCG